MKYNYIFNYIYIFTIYNIYIYIQSVFEIHSTNLEKFANSSCAVKAAQPKATSMSSFPKPRGSLHEFFMWAKQLIDLCWICSWG